MAHPHHCLVTQNYSERILTYCTRILLLDLTYGRTMTQSGAVCVRACMWRWCHAV